MASRTDPRPLPVVTPSEHELHRQRDGAVRRAGPAGPAVARAIGARPRRQVGPAARPRVRQKVKPTVIATVRWRDPVPSSASRSPAV